MTLPLDLPTSSKFDIMYAVQHPLNKLELLRKRPDTLNQVKGTVFSVPGFSAKDGFKICYYNNELICLVKKNLHGFNREAFDEAIADIRQSINFEGHRIAKLYEKQPFKRLIGLSHIHHYRMAKREMESVIRDVLKLKASDTISYKTPTSVASGLSKKMLQKVEQMPLPIAVLRNHKIDGHIYLQLPMRGHSNRCLPVVIVSSINEKVLETIRIMVTQHQWVAQEDTEFWLRQLNTLVTSINSLEAVNE